MVISLLYCRFKTFNSFISHSFDKKENSLEEKMEVKMCYKEKLKSFMGFYEKVYQITTAINKAFGFQTMITTFFFIYGVWANVCTLFEHTYEMVYKIIHALFTKHSQTFVY